MANDSSNLSSQVLRCSQTNPSPSNSSVHVTPLRFSTLTGLRRNPESPMRLNYETNIGHIRRLMALVCIIKSHKFRIPLTVAFCYVLFVPVHSCTAGVPQVHHFGQEGLHNVLVIDLLGPNLEDLFDMCGRKFSIKTVCMAAKQMVSLLS